MITKMTLKNFKGFEDFTLEGIRPITLIAGANGVGKSSLLESLFLFIDRNSSEVFRKLNAFRGIPQAILSPMMMWESLFTDADTSKPIVITLLNNGQTQTVTLSKDRTSSLSAVAEATVPYNMQREQTESIYPLNMSYSNGAYEDMSQFSLSQSGVALTHSKPITTETPFTQYLSSKIHQSPQGLSEWFSLLVKKGKKAECIEVMKLLDPRVSDVSVLVFGGISGVFADIGLASPIAVNMLGDGMHKLMHIALVMFANPSGVILIDEIENGVHYSFLPRLWEVIGKLAVETQCQILATTHSYECIKAAEQLTTGEENPDQFGFVRLDRVKGVVVPKAFDNDSFQYALEKEWEVR